MLDIRANERYFDGRDLVLVALGADSLYCESIVWSANPSIVAKGLLTRSEYLGRLYSGACCCRTAENQSR